MAPGVNKHSMDDKDEHNNPALDLILNALKAAKSQAHRIPEDVGIIKEVAKTAFLNNGLTDPKDLLVRLMVNLTNSHSTLTLL